MINTILFDMDGVLVDTEPLAISRSMRALEHYGFEYDLEILKSCIGTSFQRTLEILEEMIGQPLPTGYESKELEFDPPHLFDYKTIMSKNLKPLLHYLKEQHFKLALCSSSPIDSIQLVLQSLNLESTFDVVLSGEQFTHNKPHPEVYLNAMKQLNSKAENCLIIEDSSIGLQAGQSAGAKTVAYTNSFYTFNTDKADYVIDDLIDVIQIIESLNQ